MNQESTQKVKYIEYLPPATSVVKGDLYGATGAVIQRSNQQRGDLGHYSVIDEDTRLREYKCNKTETVVYNNTTYNLCKERERNLNTGDYIPGGLMVGSGFGDMDMFTRLKFGEQTRMMQGTIKDTDNDRLYMTHRNHGMVANYEIPEDTRHLNKKYKNLF